MTSQPFMHSHLRLLLLLACTALPFGARAQALPPVENVVQLAASGSVQTPQDWLTMTLNTTMEAADAVAAQNQLKTSLDQALNEARKSAASGLMDVRTGSFSLYPRYGKDGKITAWQGRAELILEGKDFGRISATAGKIQTLTLAHAGFSLSREQRTKVEGEAQAIAIKAFRQKAGDIAKSFGFERFTLREVAVSSQDQGLPPRPRMMAMEARSSASDAPVPVEAGQSTVVVTVSGAVQLR